jgi:hypothetical protein
MLWWLVMTRVMFGHVTTVVLLMSLALLPFWRSMRGALLRTAAVFGLCLLLCAPYLAYTKAKTGKTWCWTTVSGEMLYWVTSCNKNEDGLWFSPDVAMSDPALAPNHREFFERISKLPALQRDDEFAKKGFENLRTVPLHRLVANWMINACRLGLGFPRAFNPERPSRVIVAGFNAPLIVLGFLAVVLAVRRPRSVPLDVAMLFVFAMIYVGGSTLAPTTDRYFVVITPLLWLFVATVLKGNVKITFAPRNSR